MTDAISILFRCTGRTVKLSDTFERLGLDGVDRASIGLEVEDLVHEMIPDETVEGWQTIADVAATIDSYAKEPAA